MQRLLWGKRGVVRGSARRPVGLKLSEPEETRDESGEVMGPDLW